ncbi:MAG: glycosyltransferase [Methyloversatilis sp.]|nr:glycosyltransferase [Methyloversatilis sp.]MBP6194731.1 glycosyltransferase [Methyloversatilis sp.]MBP9118751.1 glycosyltransferase [Methyloversatilis sp.]
MDIPARLQRIHVAEEVSHGRWQGRRPWSKTACCFAVVAADAEGVREVVRYGVNGQVVDGADARAIAAEVTRLLHDAAVLREFGA